MDQLTNAVSETVSKLVESGKVQAMIEKQVETCVGKVVGDLFSPYGEFGEGLKRSLTEALRVDHRQLGLSGYNDLVLKIVKTRLDAAIDKIGTERLAQDMEELLGGYAPESVKLSEFVDSFKGWAKENRHYTDGDSVTVIVERTRSDLIWISMDPRQGVDQYMCSARILLDNDGTLHSLRIDDKDVGKTLFRSSLNDFERDLFRLWVCKTKLVVDTDDPDTWLGEGED